MKTSHYNNLRLTLSTDITVTTAPVTVRVNEDLSDATGNGLQSLITADTPMYLTIARSLNGVEQDDREIVIADGAAYNAGAGEWELNITGRGLQQSSGGNPAKTWTVSTEVPYIEHRLTVDDYSLKEDLLTKDSLWKDTGYTPEYFDDGAFVISGIDVTSEFPSGSRVQLKGDGTPTVVGDVGVSFFLSGDTRVLVNTENGRPIQNTTYNLLSKCVITGGIGECPVPFGLGELSNDGGRIGALRRVEKASGRAQMAIVPDDQELYAETLIRVDSSTVKAVSDFYQIQIAANDGVNVGPINIYNNTGQDMTIRHRKNKGAWSSQVVIHDGLDSIAMSNNDLLEVEACDVSDMSRPKFLKMWVQVDGSGNGFFNIKTTVDPVPI